MALKMIKDTKIIFCLMHSSGSGAFGSYSLELSYEANTASI